MQESAFFENSSETLGSKPTNDEVIAPAYYPLAPFQHLLEQLTEFNHGPQAIGLLIGPRKSGKSTLLSVLRSSQNQDCYHISNPQRRRLSSVEIQGLDAGEEESFSVTFEAMKSRSSQGLLLVDDADLLTLDLLQQIIECFIKQPNAEYKLVLAGESDLLGHLELLRERVHLAIGYATFFLRPLTLEETGKYLSHAFLHATNKKSKLFSPKIIEKVYQLSGGYPGRINRVASQVTSDVGYKIKLRPRKKKKTSTIDILLSLGLILLLIVLAYKFLPLQRGEEKASQKPVIAVKSENIQPAVVQETRAVVASPSFIASIEGLPEESITPTQHTLTPDLPKPISRVTLKKPVPIRSKIVPKLLGNYTVQLMAGDNRQALLTWAKSQKLMGAQTYIARKGSKSWFVLTSGSFKDKQAAQNALSKLPKSLRANGAWIRNLNTLHAK